MRLSLPAKKSPPLEDLGNDQKAIGAQLATHHRWLPQTLRGAIYDARVSIEKAETSNSLFLRRQHCSWSSKPEINTKTE
jgi:hypothetical protein